MVGYIAGHKLCSISMVLICGQLPRGITWTGRLCSLITPWKCAYLRKRRGVKNETMKVKDQEPKDQPPGNLGLYALEEYVCETVCGFDSVAE